MKQDRVLSVVGLGYVGLPVAVAFARGGWQVIGYDTDRSRIAELRAGHDRTNEVVLDRVSELPLQLTDQEAELRRADFHILCVPTPITLEKRPNLAPLLSSCAAVGRQLKTGDVVVIESTVYPGVTEEECVPVLEAESGLRFGRDFSVGYSPERINPGDQTHRFENITKVVSASDRDTLELVARVYGSVVEAGVHKAPSIQVAEAAKVIENTQRDLNIALVNELALLFDRLGLDTQDVLEAARTKWNFLPFTPGLVGGHCIGVDPYYLTYRAEQLGFNPHVILAGRQTNDAVGKTIGQTVIDALRARGDGPFTVTVLGLTFKENVPDFRNTRVVDIVETLEDAGIAVQVHDPIADPEAVNVELGITLLDRAALAPADGVVLAVAHAAFRDAGWAGIRALLIGGCGVVMDVKSALARADAPDGITLRRL